MARKKIREYDSKRLLKQHLRRLCGIELHIRSAQITESTEINELVEREPWLLSEKLVVKPDMLFGKRGKSGLVGLNLDLNQVASFVKDRLGKEVEIGGCKGPVTTFIVEPFVPHSQEFYLSIVSDRLGCNISFSECGGIEIEENWDKVRTVFIPCETSLTSDNCASLIATLPLELKGKIEEFIKAVFILFLDLDFTFLEMNPFTLANGNPYPLDMRGELDDTAAFKNFKKWGDIEFPMPFGRVMSATETFIHGLDEKCATSNPDGRKRALLIGGGIANFTDVAATFNGIIRALREKEAKLKAARMHVYVRRGGPNYQAGLAKMRKLGEEVGIPLEVYGPEATMTGICKQAIECITAAA
ncbi:ATP-citrate synthase alpha chain protein 2 isoform X2 [Phalaenopsis equestris]|uniref:ATP-citrate synthase alpha chain protein 2 isoform X2 n=1 Tax=Phalaenopsis equestris TaxID=78828 RepID=UPI0009E2AA0D|nr:ATP-citrate synthase alpha chain protein 2 isoform X2 [Phalaenopsis equestris]